MYAMIYGNVPLVRATGGLIDTVEQFQEGRGIGTGYVFDAPTGEALYDTINRACATYYNSFAEFEQLRKNGMVGDYSWDSSALKYEEIYTSAIEARSDTPS
jgi:starch synthase